MESEELTKVLGSVGKSAVPNRCYEVDGIEVPLAAEVASEVRTWVRGRVEFPAEGAEEAP